MLDVRREVGVAESIAAGVVVGVVGVLKSNGLLVGVGVGTLVGVDSMIVPAGILVGVAVCMFATSGT